MISKPLIFFALAIILFFISYEDFKHRAVTWWLFLLLLLTGIFYSNQFTIWEYWLKFFGINLTFLAVQLLFITLYFSIKNQAFVNITDSLLGWGDVLFMLCSCCFFALPYFMLFHIGSLIFSLFVVLLFPVLKIKGIPLAGLQSGVLGIVLIFFSIFQINPFDYSGFMLLISSLLT